MDYELILKNIGEKVSDFSSNLLKFISEKIGTETASFQVKILTIIFLLVLLFFSLRIAQKTTKIIIVLLIGVLIVSLFFSFFQ